MSCVGCGFELTPGFRFCPQCGRGQADLCATCGSTCKPEFSFCPSCGTARTSVPPERESGHASATVLPFRHPASAAHDRRTGEADRRQVTVLFADLSGFTRLSERLDPEIVRAFQSVLFDALTQSVSRFDGYVVKFLGDAVLALFGAPVAHEDDPERALEAALDMHARASRLSEQWAGRLGQPVALHLAVHTGPAVTGRLGDRNGAGYDVTGDIVNTASRLMGVADPGTTLVSETTWHLARHRFAFSSAVPLSLRGKSEPINVHRLIGVLADPGSARGLGAHGLHAPMVGRRCELGELEAAIGRMLSGRAQLVGITGEPGAGKSRLIAELLDRLAKDKTFPSLIVRRVACSSMGEPTYGVFASLLREGYQMRADDTLEVARRKLAAGLASMGDESETAGAVSPMLSYLLGLEEGHGSELDPEQLKRQIVLAARTLVKRRLEHGPVLIVIEDLHWADTASRELLRDIADHLADQRLMVLVSHRQQVGMPLPQRAEHTVIRLKSLPPEEVASMLDGLFGSIEQPDLARVQQLVAAQCGGNPLFIEEIVRNLMHRGALERREGRWICTGHCTQASIPPSLHGLLLSRLDSLPTEQRRSLGEAAVLGMTFEEVLLEAAGSGGSATPARLEGLAAHALIEEVGRDGSGGRRFRFTHALVHEAVYQNLLLARRTVLHERVARAIESSIGHRPSRLSDLETLGHHWSLSDDKQQGARYLTAAGDWARSLYANEDAIRHYQRALETLSECRQCEELVRDLRERLADLRSIIGARGAALEGYGAVLGDLERVADGTGAARLHRKIGRLHWEAGERELARACFANGLARLGEAGSPVERAQLFQEMGRLAFRAGDNEGAIDWARQALGEIEGVTAEKAAEQAADLAVTRAEACNTLGVALARTGRADEAVAMIGRSISLAEAHDLPQAACRAYTNLGVLYASLDPPKSIETCQRGLETARKVGHLGLQSHLYANLAVAYCALTDRCGGEGLSAAQAAVDLDRRLGLFDHLAVPLIVLGQIHQCHGEAALSFASYTEALDLAERAGEPQLLFPCYDGLATLHLDAGNITEAERYLVKSRNVCQRAGLEPEALMVLPFLC